MKFVFYPLWLLYRLWFYLLVAVVTSILSPVLFISILRVKWYKFFFQVARLWAKLILFGMGCFWSIHWEERLREGESYIFIANHTSMIDIMLMFSIVKNHPFVFVGKQELAKIPLFGFFYKRTSILVDRKDSFSRKMVFSQAQDRIKQGLSICIFPEGGVPIETVVLDSFKIGAFKLSAEHELVLVPITFLDNKKRFSFTFFSGSPGRVRALGNKFINPRDYKKDKIKQMRDKSHHIILESIIKYQR